MVVRVVLLEATKVPAAATNADAAVVEGAAKASSGSSADADAAAAGERGNAAAE